MENKTAPTYARENELRRTFYSGARTRATVGADFFNEERRTKNE